MAEIKTPTKSVPRKTTKSSPVKSKKILPTEEINKAETTPDVVAKAGKRSPKALKEVEVAQEKQARLAQNKKEPVDADKKSQLDHKPARPKAERKGKAYRKLAEQIDKNKAYSLNDGLDLATKTNPVKFDATVELHIRLNVDPKQADQNIRGTVVLPSGSGKTVRVAVYTDVGDVESAKKAGADIAGSDEFLKQLDKEIIDFDVLIAMPSMMAKLGKYAKLLGPKGLMPNPKSGTVSNDVAKAVKDAKGGRVEYRIDSSGIIHVGIGKVSFGSKKLIDNANAILGGIKSSKPSGIKGSFVRSIYATTSMGPSILIDPNIL